jgi:fatty-acyl-CoA synthase
MTETSGTGCLLLHDDVADMVGSAGRPLMGNKIRIVDEKGKEAPPNVLGEIQMKGPAVTPGYWNRPKANEESFSNGWFKTGDIGKKDSNGYIFIEDRLKDMYISGGENVYPAEVENILYELEEIKEVAIIGIPDPKWGEVGCAVVCFNDGKELTLEEIRSHCAKNLANYKIPSFLVAMEILPRSATGKVLKFELRQTIPAKLNQ